MLGVAWCWYIFDETLALEVHTEDVGIKWHGVWDLFKDTLGKKQKQKKQKNSNR